MLSTWDWNCPAPEIPTVNYQPDFKTSGINFWLEFPPTPSVTLTSTSSNLGFHSPGRAGGKERQFLALGTPGSSQSQTHSNGDFPAHQLGIAPLPSEPKQWSFKVSKIINWQMEGKWRTCQLCTLPAICHSHG